ncbi:MULTISPECIES: hypothetical protein [Streptomyces]|nr:hypothetical protein [Streptomyces ruber]
MTPLDAVESGTATGPATPGPRAPLSGRPREGYDADVLVRDEDPLVDIEVLAQPEHITGVWKAGVRVK